VPERELIEAIAAELARTAGGAPGGERGAAGGRLLRGMGDDAAVVRAGALSVTSVDAMVEGVHFRLREGWLDAAQVGHRALAGALSDIAAMGAQAGEAYLVLGLPPGFATEDALALVRGASALAAASGTVIAGGDVVAAPALTVSVTAVGWCEHEREVIARDGAQVGDIVGVTGRLGGAAAGLAVLEGQAIEPRDAPALLARVRTPWPRLREGRALSAAGVHAMIDTSDGLASDAAQLARASGVRIDVELASVPLEQGVAEVAAALGLEPWRVAAGAGDDYELCFTVARSARERVRESLAAAGGEQVTWIGTVKAGAPGASMLTLDGSEADVAGFEHSW
jgi:thiamine-monophosphate kinase